jgi:CubicO group peptidase (beta-lactamase class C family)
MAGISLGTTAFANISKGTTGVQTVSRGTTDVWSVSSPPSELTLTQRNAIDAIVSASITASRTPGCIISITGPEGFYSKAYGTTLGYPSRNLTTADHFRMGSVTKTFTGLAFWLTLDKGLVALDDVLEDYVPGIDNGDAITMAELLSMRSGVYDFTYNSGFLLKFMLTPASAYSQEEAIDLIKANAAVSAPGTEYKYVNSNAILIAAVVEAATGRRLRDIFAEDIFAPLGMTETQWPAIMTIPLPATGTAKLNPELFGAAGCLTSTVGDLTKWLVAMRDGALISTSSDALRKTTFLSTIPNNLGGPTPPNDLRYGYFMMGFGSWIGHEGTVAANQTACVYDTVSGATIAVSQNKSGWLTGGTEYYTTMRNIAAYLYPDSVIDP